MAKGAGATTLSSLAGAAKKIAAGIHRVLFCLHNYFVISQYRVYQKLFLGSFPNIRALILCVEPNFLRVLVIKPIKLFDAEV
jgi:hypothetical protein